MATQSTSLSRSTWCIGIAVGILCVSTTRVATAEPEAEALFNRGLASMRSGEFASACPDLAASYDREPLPGVLFTLAECEAAWGKVATAISHYQLLIDGLPSLSPERRKSFDERRRLALEKIAVLSAIVPFITINLAAGAPPDVVIRRNATVIDSSTYGVGKPVDPGDYVITAELAGKKQWERHLRVATHDRAQIEVPWPLQPPEPVVKGPAAPPPSQPPQEAAHSLGPWKFVAAGVGVAGIATSLVSGAIALGKKSDVDQNCPNYRCNAQGRDSLDAAQLAARVSTVSFIVGLVGAAGFVGLSLYRPSESASPSARMKGVSVAVENTAGGAALNVKGSF